MAWKPLQSPLFLLVAATCLWGGNFVVGRAIVPFVPPLLLAELRWTLALLVTLPYWGGEFWRHRSRLLQHWRPLLLLSLTGIAGFNTLLYIAVQYTSPINAALMNSATPILIVLVTPLMLGGRLRWGALPAMGLSIAGVLWIVTRGSWEALLGLSFNRGDLWMMLAVACWAVYTVGMKKYAGMLPPRALFVTTVLMGSLILLPFTVGEWIVRRPDIAWSPGILAGILYIGILASVAALTAWNAAVAAIGPSRCSGFLNLIPLFSAVFAILFTGESLHAYHLIGALLIISGVYLVNRQAASAPRTPPIGESAS
ncbi:hypothetical protein PM3016_3488 [Paenibacillus mucilaginosus 3016]|uniref:EamA domain-containing protein n=1 Tax=Paenibacillus mucilaginosus 3016 TaxID=1116391 RepID=H6NLD9_9BACL|nr:DMT family transporter [Paenibacillus mucilaginosus]AFC30321.1 hypothetical protein PM3016_3488 [Paenibacillus mucilaginosus 3016]WFA18958.1 DMT family transporter [Paenibacillus mucilaginosus]